MFNTPKLKRKKKILYFENQKEFFFIIKRFNNNDIIFERFKRAKRNYQFYFQFRNFIIFFSKSFNH